MNPDVANKLKSLAQKTSVQFTENVRTNACVQPLVPALDVVRFFNEDTEKPHNSRFQLRTDACTDKRAEAIAKKHGKSRSQVYRLAIHYLYAVEGE